jgi:hypothetical protein
MWRLWFILNWLFLLENGLGSSLLLPLKIVIILHIKFSNRVYKGFKGLVNRIFLIIRINFHVKRLNDSVSKSGVSMCLSSKMPDLLNFVGYSLFILSIKLFKSFLFLKKSKLFDLLIFLLLIILLRVNFRRVRPVYYWVYDNYETDVLLWLTEGLEFTFLLWEFIEYVDLVQFFFE